MNQAHLLGRITADAEIRYTTGGTAVTNFTLAVNKKYKQEGQPTADFISVVAWGKLAEFIVNYTKKGQQIVVSGRIQVRSYEDSQNIKRTITEIVAEEIQLTGSKPKDEVPNNDNTDNWEVAEVDNDTTLPF